ncbi:hypothetical protein FGADI_7415 [Fusarium gaditjirri]|uniref:Uncharacterized protein n=1 Tax=Fusarium gaditjirri TaxID=282569 RepID=A0A8H4T574_9HYPO|nr:hypothetical protein FGADI_7415 [Fusarium gaditjirri]
MADELTVFLRAVYLMAYCIQSPSYLDITEYVEFGLASAALNIIVRCSETLGVAIELASDASLELTAEALVSLEIRLETKFPKHRRPLPSCPDPPCFESSMLHVNAIAGCLNIPGAKFEPWGCYQECMAAAVYGKLGYKLDVELLNDKNFEQMASRLCEVELVLHTWSSCDPLCHMIHHLAVILSYSGFEVATELDGKCEECGNVPSIVVSKHVLSLCQPVEIHTWLMDDTGTLQQQAFTFTTTAHGIEKGYLGKKRKRSQASE